MTSGPSLPVRRPVDRLWGSPRRAKVTVLNPIRITVRVHPRSTRRRRAWDGTVLELWIHEPPVDGAANAAVVADVARWLGISRRLVRVVAGATARTKVLEIEGPVVVPPADGV